MPGSSYLAVLIPVSVNKAPEDLHAPPLGLAQQFSSSVLILKIHVLVWYIHDLGLSLFSQQGLSLYPDHLFVFVDYAGFSFQVFGKEQTLLSVSPISNRQTA